MVIRSRMYIKCFAELKRGGVLYCTRLPTMARGSWWCTP